MTLDPRTGAVVYSVHGDRELMVVPQILNATIRRGPVGADCWEDQW